MPALIKSLTTAAAVCAVFATLPAQQLFSQAAAPAQPP